MEAVLGRRDAGVGAAQPAGSPARERIDAAVARPSLFGSYLAYLGTTGFAVDPSDPASTEEALVAVYAADGGPRPDRRAAGRPGRGGSRSGATGT